MTKDAVEAFCARIGADPLLVQDAGGNVSWKDAGVLWVKASGTRMADALRKPVFVPVDARQARSVARPDVLGEGASLRPSIETMLHALMPQRVVAHLHAIEAIAHLIQREPAPALAALLEDADCAWVPYRKPGLPLAEAVAAALAARPTADVLLLANHGVVVAGDDVDDVRGKLDALIARLRRAPRELGAAPIPQHVPTGYAVPRDVSLQALAHDAELLARAAHDWAICPDHVVFLGPQAPLFDDVAALSASAVPAAQRPAAIVRGLGVFVADAEPARRQTAETLLRCYVETMRRVPPAAAVRSLPDDEVAALVHWEAEAYRRAMKHQG